MNYIYCYTNLITNRTYIGQTNNINRRKSEHLYSAYHENDSDYNLMFHKKIREYGIENFSFEILEEVEDLTSANDREIYWIKEKKSFIKENGYNMTLGGNQPERIRKIDEKQLLVIIDELKNTNKTFSEIGEKFDLTSPYISMINTGKKFFNPNIIYPIRKSRKKSKEQIDKMIDLLQNTTLTMKQIANIVGMGYSTVKKYNYGISKIDYIEDYPIRKPVSTIAGQAASTSSIDTEGETGVGA